MVLGQALEWKKIDLNNIKNKTAQDMAFKGLKKFSGGGRMGGWLSWSLSDYSVCPHPSH